MESSSLHRLLPGVINKSGSCLGRFVGRTQHCFTEPLKTRYKYLPFSFGREVPILHPVLLARKSEAACPGALPHAGFPGHIPTQSHGGSDCTAIWLASSLLAGYTPTMKGLQCTGWQPPSPPRVSLSFGTNLNFWEIQIATDTSILNAMPATSKAFLKWNVGNGGTGVYLPFFPQRFIYLFSPQGSNEQATLPFELAKS